MKTYLKIPTLLAAIFFMIAMVGCTDTQDAKTAPPAASTPVKKVKPLKIEGGEEILIAKDVTNVKPSWCDNNTLVFNKRHKGIFFYNKQEKKTINIADYGNVPLACSPDGKWLVYLDKFSGRYDTESSDETIADLWRYEFKTGLKQKFFVAPDGYLRTYLFKPDEPHTLFLGTRPTEHIEMPEPKWQVLWSHQENIGYSNWLNDGSAIIGHYVNLKTRKKALVIIPQVLGGKIVYIYHDFSINGSLILDDQDRIYMKISDSNEKYLQIVRCRLNLKKESLSCDPVLYDEHSVNTFDVFSDNETIIFNIYGEDCIKVKLIGEEEEKCITNMPHETGSHAIISPDNKWVAVTSSYQLKDERIGLADLHIVELKTTQGE